MNRETINSIVAMIEKECCRDNLADLCEYWGVTCEDFEDFLNAAAGILEKEE